MLIWSLAWLLLRFRGLPACPCVHAYRVYRSQASFDGGARSDGICMTVFISASKIHASGSVWLGLCDRPSGLGGRLAMVARSADHACAGLCGSSCAGGWQKTGPCSCRAINSSGSELCRSCDQLFVCGCYLPADWGGRECFPPEGGVLPSRPGAGPADRT